MEINYIKIKNINSLKGEHFINFKENPLLDAGLFAIVGPTGSGKSTLLDALCLALFNRIPRLGTISKNAIISSGSIINHHAKDASAEVSYTCRKGTYISQWQIAYNRNDNLNDYQMSLWNEDLKEQVDLKKGEIPAFNEQLIGLSFEQFVKSMLLAQGEFAKFLKSSEDERNQILERITGSEIYRHLGNRANEIGNEKGRKLKELQERKVLKSAELLPDEELNFAKAAQSQLEKEVETIQADLQNIEKMLEAYQQAQIWKEKLKKSNELLEVEKDKHQNFINQYAEALEKHKQLIPYESALETYERNKVELQKLKTELGRIEQQKLTHKDKLTLWKESFRAILHPALSLDDNWYMTLKQYQAEYTSLVNQRKEKVQLFDNLRGKLPKEPTDIVPDWKQPENTRKEIEKRYRDAQAWLADNNKLIPEGLNASEQLQVLRDTRMYLLEKEKLSNRHAQLKQKTNDLQTEIENQSKQLIKCNTDQGLFEEEIRLCKKEVELLEKEYQLMMLGASLEEHRQRLVDGEPCPLCGALEHPFASKESGNVEEIKAKWELTKAMLKTIEHNKIEKEKQASTLENSIKSNKKILAENLQEQESIEEQLQSVLSKIQVSSIDDLNSQIAKVEAYMDKTTKLEQLQQWQQAWGEISELIEQGKALKDRMEALFPGNDQSSKLSELEETWIKLEAEQRNIEDNLKAKQHEFGSLMASHEHQLKELNRVLKVLGHENPEEALKCKMTAYQYNQLKDEEQALVQSINQLLSETKNAKDRLNEYHELKGENEVENLVIQNKEKQQTLKDKKVARDKERDKITLHENLALEISTLEEQIQKEGKEARKWALLKELIGGKDGKNFSQFAQTLNMKRLLQASNARLKQLSARYIMATPEDAEMKDLIVYDLEMGAEPRSISTLSGGETFLLSLSLALGLADLASQKVDIRSLFIDEGFGTLDPDTLEATMSMLEKLQMESGKTIGIISHVETLKERIRCKIVLEKKGQGYSELKIIG